VRGERAAEAVAGDDDLGAADPRPDLVVEAVRLGEALVLGLGAGEDGVVRAQIGA